jgi:transmembrane 9 superfamily protein 2/4
VPLSACGTLRAQDPVRTNKIPRQVPEQPWYMHPLFSILIGGILPFGAVFIELFFILTSMWLHQFYYLFGFLALVFIILIITCAEITVVLAYFQLCSGGRRRRSPCGWPG